MLQPESGDMSKITYVILVMSVGAILIYAITRWCPASIKPTAADKQTTIGGPMAP